MMILIALAASPILVVHPVSLQGVGTLRCEEAMKPERELEFDSWVRGYFSGRNSGAGKGDSSIVGSKVRGGGVAEVRQLCEAEPATIAAGAAERAYRRIAAEHR
ncbi:MAG: hypothetical protein QOJ94_1453 [Sphingomonadales bacterium]|jgi:hypothetical protein|nr:hypothetical protein [Sphingomonadales bacterium]